MTKHTEHIELKAEKREITGKKVKHLRKEGKVPANIFGSGIPSQAITVNGKELLGAYRKVGETQVLYVTFDKENIPTVIANIQIHPVTEDLLHADFRKVDLTIKTEASVPVTLIGEEESPAMKSHVGDVLTLMHELTVEALPEDMPQEIAIDITSLENIDDEIKVSDLKKSSTYEVKEDPDSVIVKVSEHKEEDIEPDTTAEILEAGEEGEAPAEGGSESSDASEGQPESSEEEK